MLHFGIWASLVFVINLVATSWGSVASSIEKCHFFEGEYDQVKWLYLDCISRSMRLAQFFFGWLKLHHAVRVCDTSGNRSNSYTSSSCVAPDWSSRYSEPHKNQSPSFTVVVLTWALVFILAPFVSHRYGFMYVETDEYSYKSELYGSVSSNSYWTVAASESFITDANCMKCPVDAPGIEVERASSLGNHGRTRGRHALPTSEMPSILQNLRLDTCANNLHRLSPAECMDSYARNMQSTRGNVLHIASN